MHTNISKKIFAIVTTLSLSVLLVGPVQAVTIEELLAQIAVLQAQLLQLQQAGTGGTASSAACTGITFSRNLSQGMSGTDVKCLQSILNQSADTQVAVSGGGSAGNETMLFGPLTKAAVVKFQVKYAADILTPLGLTQGTGFVGSSTRAKLTSLVGTTGGSTTPVGGTNTIGLSADNPAAVSIAKGAQNVIFAKMNLCAASVANTVSKLAFTRGGLAADTDITSVKLYEGSTQIGSTQAINTTLHTATFSSLNLTIAANACRVLTVKASISDSATTGNSPKLSIASASDITSTVALDGVFPISSNAMTIAGISVGALLIATTTPSGSVIAGATEQGVAGFIFTASSSGEGVKLTSITLREVGSSVDSDVSNIKLMYQSTQLGATVASLSNGAATFDLSASPLEILVGTSKTVTVYTDIGVGTGIKDRTIQFEITDKTNVVAYGTNSGGTVIAYGTSIAADTFPQKGASISVSVGALTISKDTAYSPSVQNYTRGTNQDKIVAFKFTAGANEGTRITSIKLHSASGTNLADSSVSNVTLYDAETGNQLTDTAGNLVPSSGMVSGWVTFGSYTTGFDTVGLFDIEASKNKIVMVKADVPQGAATATSALGLEIDNPTTQVWADGLSSKTDIPAASINAGLTTQVPSTELLHHIIAKGTLTVSPSSGTPAAAFYAVGTNDYTFAKFDFTSTGEDILVTQLNVFFGTTSGATTTTAGNGDVNNVRLYDGSTLLQTDTTISSGNAQFAINLTVPQNTTKTLTIMGNIPSGSGGGGLQAWIGYDNLNSSQISASGKSSNVTITPVAASWGNVKGNYMTKAVPIVTVTTATVPASQTYIKNASGVKVATIYLTATPTEDVRITRIQIFSDSTSTATTTVPTSTTTLDSLLSTAGDGMGGFSPRDYVGEIQLFDSLTQLGSTLSLMTAGTNYDTADFTGLALTVPKGTTKVIDVKVKVLNSTTSTGDANAFYFGIATTTGTAIDVSGSGVQSGAAATISIAIGGVTGQPMFLGGSGTLVVANDVNMPYSAVITEGSTPELGKWKFTARNESISISKLVFDAHNSVASTGVSISGSGFESGLFALATTGPGLGRNSYYFNYSVNDGATSTCGFWWGQGLAAATTTANFIAAINSASSTCGATSTFSGIWAAAGLSGSSVILWASSSDNTYRSLEITDYTLGHASNTADELRLGVKYGGTETVGRYDGVVGNIAGGNSVSLWDGATKLAESSLIGRSVTFTPTSDIVIPTTGKVLTLKGQIADFSSAEEGSTLSFSIGSSTADTDTVTYITAKGGSSGTELVDADVTMDAEKAGNEMWVYATKPVVSLNGASPSGSQTISTNGEVFRFDVNNSSSNFDLAINAIRFSISTNASSAIWDKNFNLYKSGDSTIIGSGLSWAQGTSSAQTGFVTIYPVSGNQVGVGTVTYILKANTSAMDTKPSANDILNVSIQDGDIYWDDSVTITGAANANQKTLNLPVTGGTLIY